MKRTHPILDWLALNPLSQVMKWRKLGPVISVAAIVLAVALLTLLIGTIIRLAGFVFTDDLGPDAIRGLSFLFAFLIGAPFVIWRSIVAQKQVDTAQAGLINDKITAATESLHAMRQVMKPAAQGKLESHWDDDIIRRSAAIDQLESLADEEPAEARRIARMLCTYVKELSREYKAEEPPEDLKDVDWADEPARGTAHERLAEWTKTLTAERPDMERAVESLSRMNTNILAAEAALGIGMASTVPFPAAQLQVDWADPAGRRSARAAIDTWHRRLWNSDQRPKPVIDLEGANLQNMRLRGLDLRFATLTGAQMQGADLSGAKMQGAGLSGAQMDKFTNLTDAIPSAASVRLVTVVSGVLRQDQITQMFGDNTTTLPDDLTRPAHWPPVKLEFDAFLAEWKAYQADPAGYDWAQRKHRYSKGEDYT